MGNKIPFPLLNVCLNNPTTTSKHQQIAVKFDGDKGIIIRFNNDGIQNNVKNYLFFDVS